MWIHCSVSLLKFSFLFIRGRPLSDVTPLSGIASSNMFFAHIHYFVKAAVATQATLDGDCTPDSLGPVQSEGRFSLRYTVGTFGAINIDSFWKLVVKLRKTFRDLTIKTIGRMKKAKLVP